MRDFHSVLEESLNIFCPCVVMHYVLVSIVTAQKSLKLAPCLLLHAYAGDFLLVTQVFLNFSYFQAVVMIRHRALLVYALETYSFRCFVHLWHAFVKSLHHLFFLGGIVEN